MFLTDWLQASQQPVALWRNVDSCSLVSVPQV